MIAYRRWLQAQIRWCRAQETDEAVCADCAGIMRMARHKALDAGLADVAELLRCQVDRLGPLATMEYLSAAIAAMPDSGLMSVPQVARRYGVSPVKVRGWITSGQLRATNTGKRRTRYRITLDALAEFDARGVAVPARRAKRRHAIERY